MKMPALGTKVILLSALAAVSPLVAPAVRAAAPAVVVWDPEQSADMPRFWSSGTEPAGYRILAAETARTSTGRS